MKKKLTKKDLKDWKKFINSKEKIPSKDIQSSFKSEKGKRVVDLHGFTLEDANNFIKKIILESYSKKISKIEIITGKGLRSKVSENPYMSVNLNLLKYSVPEFINSNIELKSFVKSINYEQVNDKNSGFFSVFLKIKE